MGKVLDKTPTYNLKVVLHDTGIKPDTLRAWERRYRLPVPARTEGGHRLYSEFDIATVKWLMDRQKEGMRINHAVKLWHSLEEQAKDPFKEMPIEEGIVDQPRVDLLSGSTLEQLRQTWISACMGFDQKAADTVLAQSFASYPVETVCIEILRKGLYEIGELWYSDSVTVQQEHFASALAIRHLDSLITAAPDPIRSGKVIIGCPPGEDHVFSPLLITLFLRRRGWDIVYLGANVPLERFERAVNTTNPDLIIMTAMQLYTASNLLKMAHFFQEINIPVAYGGRIFSILPDLKAHIAGFYLGDILDYVVDNVEKILLSSSKPVLAVPVPSEYLSAKNHFQEMRPDIEAHLWETIRTNEFRSDYIQIANEHLARDIEASLAFGSMDYLDNEIIWLETLLVNYHLPDKLLIEYFQHYRTALSNHLDERGEMIINWLDQFLEDQE